MSETTWYLIAYHLNLNKMNNPPFPRVGGTGVDSVSFHVTLLLLRYFTAVNTK